jgi:formate dehydrogenase major subunit
VAGSPNIDTPASVYAAGLIPALRAVYGDAGVAIASQADLKSADLIVVIGADPSQKKQSLQEVEVMIRRRVQAGAKIIVVNPEKIELAGHQNAIHLQLKEGTDTVLLAGLMSAAIAEGATSPAKGFDALKKSLVSVDSAASTSGVSTEQLTNAGKALAAAKEAIIIVGTGISANEDASLQALNLALMKKAGVLPLMLEANALGTMQMGCVPDMGPGAVKVKKAGKGYNEMRSGMKALYVAGNVGDADFKSDMIIVQASHMTPFAEKADLVLPMTALYERQGTVMNTYGAVKTVAAAQHPAGETKDGLEIAADISAAMSKTKAFKAKDIVSAVKKVKTGKIGAGSFRPVEAKASKPDALYASVLIMTMNQGLLTGSGVSKVLVVKQPTLQK